MSTLSAHSSITEIILKNQNYTIYIITINELIAHLSFSIDHHLLAASKIPFHYHAKMTRKEPEINNPICIELKEYLTGNRRNFNLAINPFFIDCASALRKKIWLKIAAIPYGSTAYYSDIGLQLGNPALARAVGQAAKANPIGLIIPCHRVTGKNGMGGYAGGTVIKKSLLQLESENRGGSFHEQRNR